MAKIKCFHCKKTWPLGTADTNRCPGCGWIVEIYYDRNKADRVARTYNEQDPPSSCDYSGVEALLGVNGFSVSFPDQGRLAEVAAKLLDQESE